MSVPEETPVTEIETSAEDNLRWRGEREATNEQGMNEKVAGETNNKPRKRRVRSLAAAGARTKKKKSKLSKKKWELRRMKHHGHTNVRRRKLCEQHRVPWDPGGFICETSHQKCSRIKASTM
jgi:hypothetical protein